MSQFCSGDDRTSYLFLKAGELPNKTKIVSQDKVDFVVPRDEEAIQKGHTEDLPLSFFSIAEGDIESGKDWYLSKFPKLPEEFAYLLSRYNFGDLKYATKKSLRNARKKSIKKTGQPENITKGMKISRKPVLINFD
jgi:hypothetical protein